MPPRKRAAANDGEGATTRAKKAAKTENGQSAPKGRRGRSKATAEEHDAAFKEFKEKALPIHVSFTHTPPSIDKDDGEKAKKDEGYIGNLTIVPSAFSTGSFGWKGTKRVKVELQGAEGKETVQLQIQINAVVHGSKDAGAKDDEDEENKEKDKDDEEKADEDGDDE